MINNFLFTKDKERNKRVWSAFKAALKTWGTTGKETEVVILEHKRHKSYEQIKGYYRLVNMILPVIKEQNPDHFIDKNVVDNLIKDRYSYYTNFDGVKTYKSKSESTIKDMIGLIKTAEQLGAMFDIPDCYLSSEEELALKEFYEKAS